MNKKEELIELVNNLKKRYGRRICSNCYNYNAFDRDEAVKIISRNECVMAVVDEERIRRLYFFIPDNNSLETVLEIIREEHAVLELVSRNCHEKEIYLSLGFNLHCELRRYSCKEPSLIVFQKPEKCFYYKAELQDAEDIKEKLFSVFDPKISHIGSLGDIRCSIEENSIYISRDSYGSIVSLLEVVMDKTKLYINQVYNDKGNGCIHSIMQDVISSFIGTGGKYIYAWIPEDNEASKRFHAKYNLEPDELYTFIFE